MLESWKLNFSIFFSTERTKQSYVNLKIIRNFLRLQDNHFWSYSSDGQIFFRFFIENLAFSIPWTQCTGTNHDLHSKCNISKKMWTSIPQEELTCERKPGKSCWTGTTIIFKNLNPYFVVCWFYERSRRREEGAKQDRGWKFLSRK